MKITKANKIIFSSIIFLILSISLINIYLLFSVKKEVISLRDNQLTDINNLAEKIENSFANNEDGQSKIDLKLTSISAILSNLTLANQMNEKNNIIVYANKGWQKSGYFVSKGDTVQIVSTGLWTADYRIPIDRQNTNLKYFGWVNGEGNYNAPSWYTEYGPTMQLLGKINDRVFNIGESNTLTIMESGELEFAPNDLCCLRDNDGFLIVKIINVE